MFEVGTIKGANNRVQHNVYENGFTWYARATTLEAAERIAQLLNEDDMQLRIANRTPTLTRGDERWICKSEPNN